MNKGYLAANWVPTCTWIGDLGHGYAPVGAFRWGIMKKLVLLLLIVALPLAHADDSKISPELRGNYSNQKVQVIVQYAPGTQVSCSGLLGLVDCLVNDVLKLGGTILGQLPLVNGVVALLDGNGIQNLSNQSNVVYISTDRPLTPSLNNAAAAVNARVRVAVELHRCRALVWLSSIAV